MLWLRSMKIHCLKGTATQKARDFEIQALIKPFNLRQTRSKSNVKLESYSNLKKKIKILTSDKPMEAVILNI